jgi:hypothetical protein
LHPDLKTHMLEHNWLQNAPEPCNPAFVGCVPYFFNAGLASTPITLFYDGHVAYVSTEQAIEDDAIVKRQDGVGLWSRDTPKFRGNGYYGNYSYDGAITGYHILTVDGILGRDVLTAP